MVSLTLGSTVSALISFTRSSTSRKFRSVSIRTRSTPDMISLITFCRALAFG
jgi:hypothetical protein